MIAFHFVVTIVLRVMKLTREQYAFAHSGSNEKELFETYKQKYISTDDREVYQKEALMVTQYPSVLMIPPVIFFFLSSITALLVQSEPFSWIFKIAQASLTGAVVTTLFWMYSGWYGYYRMKKVAKRADQQGSPIAFKTHWISQPSDAWVILGIAVFLLMIL